MIITFHSLFYPSLNGKLWTNWLCLQEASLVLFFLSVFTDVLPELASQPKFVEEVTSSSLGAETGYIRLSHHFFSLNSQTEEGTLYQLNEVPLANTMPAREYVSYASFMGFVSLLRSTTRLGTDSSRILYPVNRLNSCPKSLISVWVGMFSNFNRCLDMPT